MPGDHARWYRIVVRGEVGSLLAASLGETEVTSFHGWPVPAEHDPAVLEIAGVLMALLPTVGTARVTVAASAIRAVLDHVLT
jgi:hypothetical protein